MTTLSSARTALTSRQRREKNLVTKDVLGQTKKLMEIHADPEADPRQRARTGQYLAWQTQRLSVLSSAIDGDN